MTQGRETNMIQVGRKRLSTAAYHRSLEASRRWKREHPSEADRHNWKVCSCGQRMSHDAAECRDCRDEREASRIYVRRQRVVQMWAAGLLLREIAAELGWTLDHLRSEFGRMRAAGYDLPLRRGGRPRSIR